MKVWKMEYEQDIDGVMFSELYFKFADAKARANDIILDLGRESEWVWDNENEARFADSNQRITIEPIHIH